MNWKQIVNSDLNLRAGPSKNFMILRVLKLGTAVLALGPSTSDSWINVQTVDGVSGWISSAYTMPHSAPWYAVAQQYEAQGITAIPGPKAHPLITHFHSYTLLKATSDEVAWCSSFVCACLEEAGQKSTKSAAARSYLNYGIPLETPRQGAITVFRRGASEEQGHVAFFQRREGSKIYVLGGNQSHTIKVSAYNAADLLGYRWPKL